MFVWFFIFLFLNLLTACLSDGQCGLGSLLHPFTYWYENTTIEIAYLIQRYKDGFLTSKVLVYME